LNRIDKQFIINILQQIKIIRNNFHKIVNEPNYIKILNAIISNKENIFFIKSLDKYCQIYDGSSNWQDKIFRGTLKTIKLYFPDEYLIQVHRSFLVNPKKIKQVQKNNKGKWELLIANQSIPVGNTYIEKIIALKFKPNSNSTKTGKT